MNEQVPAPSACPLPRWPRLIAELARRGWKIHHLARLLDEKPSVVWAWLYGRQPMPHHLRRRVERLLDLPGILG